MKRFLILVITALLIILSFCSCSASDDGNGLFPTEESMVESVPFENTTILFTANTNGICVSNGQVTNLGYAQLAAYRDSLDGTVLLVDGGNAADYGSLDQHMKLFENVNYDVRVPGALELSHGVEAFEELIEDYDVTHVSVGLLEYGYVFYEMGGYMIAFVGISPYDELEESVLFDRFQQAVDDASKAGADYVFGIGCFGTDLNDAPYTVVDLISNTAGLTAFLTGGTVLEGSTVTDLEDREIPICGVGSDFAYIGQIELDPNSGLVEIQLISEYSQVDEKIQNQASKLDK